MNYCFQCDLEIKDKSQHESEFSDHTVYEVDLY
jgi:hypothetical protein